MSDGRSAAVTDQIQPIADDHAAKCVQEGNHYHVYIDYDRRSAEGFSNG